MSSTEKWTIITGASSGIGKALAFEFAKHGFNLFLTARNEKSLAEIANECQNKFNVKAQFLSADLSDLESTNLLVSNISGRRFDVLVNNAGFGVKGDFVETLIDEEVKMLDVQLVAMLKLTKAVLPKMIEQRSGKILNVASVYSFAPVPMQSVYSACKAFLLSFSSSLRNEIGDSGVSVTVLCPGITKTEFRTRAGINDKKDSGMTAAEVAKAAFSQTMKGKHIVVPGFQNQVFVILSKYFPTGLLTTIVRFINDRRGVNKTS
jgi:short-subunit dehydrogenase